MTKENIKNSHLTFEILLLSITTLFVFILLVSNDNRIALLLFWFFALGIFQVSHSIIIGLNYWKNIKIRRAIIIYWIGAIINLSFTSAGSLLVKKAIYTDFIRTLTPLLALAVYLLWITWHFCEPVIKQKST